MRFAYKARTPNGEINDGIVEASNQDGAVSILHNKGLTILSLAEAKKEVLTSDLNQILERPNAKDVVVFTRQLSTLIDADMPISEGLRTLSKQVEKASFRKIINSISEAVENGASLSSALSIYPKLFSPFYIKLIQSGELSGKLHKSLDYLAEYMEKSRAINSKIKGALSYPAFVVFSLVVVMAIMVIYVLPKLLTIFKEVGVTDLPLTTRILIWFTDVVNNNLYLLTGILVLLITGLVYFLRTKKGIQWLDRFKVTVPIFGTVIRNLYLARMGESLATLVASGISILDALHITADVVNNHVYRLIILDAEESVRGGGSISDVFSRHEEVPPLFASMVAIGEKTGKLDYMLQHISTFYKAESDSAIENISQLIEPILVLVLGVGVAILVSSILLPIYSLVGAS